MSVAYDAKTAELENERFERARMMLAEWFPDYVVIVRNHSGMIWRASDPAWAEGAMLEYIRRNDERQRHEMRARMDSEAGDR